MTQKFNFSFLYSVSISIPLLIFSSTNSLYACISTFQMLQVFFLSPLLMSMTCHRRVSRKRSIEGFWLWCLWLLKRFYTRILIRVWNESVGLLKETVLLFELFLIHLQTTSDCWDMLLVSIKVVTAASLSPIDIESILFRSSRPKVSPFSWMIGILTFI